MFRLKIVEHFESMRNELDLFTETKIRENVDLESFWNKRREEQIEALNQREQSALTESVKEVKQDEECNMSLYSKFCFLFENDGLMFVATVDKFVEAKEIELFKKFLKIGSMSSFKRSNFLLGGKRVFKTRYMYLESDAIEKLEQLLTVDSAVVDMSWWFNRDYHLDELTISGEIYENTEEFVCPVRIDTLEIKISFPLCKNLTLNEAKVRSIKRILNGFGQVNSAIVSLKFDLSEEFFDEEQAQSIAWLLPSIKQNPSTTLLVLFNDPGSGRFYHDYCTRFNQPSFLNAIRITEEQITDGWLSKLNGGNIVQIVFYRCSASLISNTDLSSLCSVKTCEFNNSSGSFAHWKFLDPIRANLEHLKFDYNLGCISSELCQGMTKLKSLELKKFEFQVDVGLHINLFADLVQLKSLKFCLNKYCIEKDWLCELPALENLEITLSDIPKNADIQVNMRFNCPKLVGLKCWNWRDEFDASPMFSCLSHVRVLDVSSRLLEQGWYRGFKCSELVCHDTNHLSRSLFTGLESITTLEVDIDVEKVIDRDSFHELVNLQTVKLRGVDQSWLESNQDMFDGLRHLNCILLAEEYSHFSRSSSSLVHFNNLDKFVLVYGQ